MIDKRGKVNAVLALMLLAAVSLACSSLKNLGKNPTQEVSKLVGEATEDLQEIDRIDEEATQKQRDLNKAMNDKNVDEAKRLLGELVKDIEKGLEKGKDAADKVEQASKLDVNTNCKEYLSIKAQAFRKEVEAWTAMRDAAVIARDNYTAQGLPADKRTEYTNKYNDFKKLRQEARDLHKKASDIARANPNMCK
ncbi:MAG TPA: hypothetical protein VF543_21130 [Pyrinomonadaceae bacterium]|jgi:membrane-associated HD superfamily phosphohydrolase